VTGSSRGIEKATALALTAENCKVTICARHLEMLKQTVAEIQGKGGTVMMLKADVTSTSDLEILITRTVEEFGKLNILVNNVGGTLWKPFLEVTDNEFRRLFDLNFFSSVQACRLALPHMLASGDGAIVSKRCFNSGRERR
jgi:NAD(P)-dependent dehydrogenase (short-subunit alcohol dehydrogenase family)